MRFELVVATFLVLQSHHAFAQAVYIKETTLLCDRADDVHSLHTIKPPGSGVPGSAVIDTRGLSEIFRYGKCIWLSPMTSLLQTGREGDLSRVQITGRPSEFFVETLHLTAGVGATPTPVVETDDQKLELAKAAAERMIDNFRQRLQPTPAQQPLFDAYVQAQRTYILDAAKLDREFARDIPKANAVMLLNLRQRGMQFEADRLRGQLPLLQRLYDVLTPTQKIAADRFFSP